MWGKKREKGGIGVKAYAQSKLRATKSKNMRSCLITLQANTP
jgi:hypothetical protein